MKLQRKVSGDAIKVLQVGEAINFSFWIYKERLHLLHRHGSLVRQRPKPGSQIGGLLGEEIISRLESSGALRKHLRNVLGCPLKIRQQLFRHFLA